MTDSRLFYLHALTPLHSGTGQSAGVIDLPIAREKATGHPTLPASGIKGVFRDAYQTLSGDSEAKKLFGTTEESGAVRFTDGRILCLPVRSLFGTFAFVTCPLVLARLERDAEALDVPLTINSSVLSVEELAGIVPDGSKLEHAKKIYLEDLDLTAQTDPKVVTEIATTLATSLFPDNPAYLTSRFVLVANNLFAFLSETATEVAARIKLKDDTKNVDAKSGGLWYEESVPAEAIFYGFALLSDHAKKKNDPSLSLENLDFAHTFQFGGKTSVGRGICRVVTGGTK